MQNSKKLQYVCSHCQSEFFDYFDSRTKEYKHRFCNRKCYSEWIKAPIEERLLRYCDEPDANGCINFNGNINHSGYGVLHTNDGTGKRILSHRVSWIRHNGTIPDGLFILHKCDNPRCVNIDHLFIGTRDDNNKDMFAKMRHSHGEKHHNHKLTENQVREIRKLYATGLSQSKIGNMFGLPQQRISKIVNRKCWAHVS